MFAHSRYLLMLLTPIAFLASLIPGGEPAELPVAAEEVIERFPMKKDSCWIMLPVDIKGYRFHFGLDTGAYCTVYDKALWHLMGKTISLEKIGTKEENVTVPIFQPPDARLGKLTLSKDSCVPGSDLRDFREDSGEELHGFLGMDFLKRHIFRTDFDRGEVVFLRTLGPDPGQRLAIRLTGDRPQVKIDLPWLKKPEWIVLDTGMARGSGWFGGFLRKSTFEALAKSGNLTSIGESSDLGFAGRKICRIGRLDFFPFAGDTHRSLWFSEGDVSFLGLDVLSRYVVTFDFPHRAIYLKKGRQFNRPIHYDRSGLWVRRVKGQTGVARVMEGSAAAKAGILPGDTLLQIDKEQINGMTLFTLCNRLCEAGKKIHLTIRRGEQQMDVSVVLSSDR